MRRHLKRTIAIAVAVTLPWAYTGQVSALLIPAETTIAPASVERTQDLKTVQTFLEQKQVRQQLTEFGLSENQVQARLNQLSDQELHRVATQIEKQNPGADGAGAVVTVLLIGILVLLFVYLVKRV